MNFPGIVLSCLLVVNTVFASDPLNGKTFSCDQGALIVKFNPRKSMTGSRRVVIWDKDIIKKLLSFESIRHDPKVIVEQDRVIVHSDEVIRNVVDDICQSEPRNGNGASAFYERLGKKTHQEFYLSVGAAASVAGDGEYDEQSKMTWKYSLRFNSIGRYPIDESNEWKLTYRKWFPENRESSITRLQTNQWYKVAEMSFDSSGLGANKRPSIEIEESVNITNEILELTLNNQNILNYFQNSSETFVRSNTYIVHYDSQYNYFSAIGVIYINNISCPGGGGCGGTSTRSDLYLHPEFTGFRLDIVKTDCVGGRPGRCSKPIMTANWFFQKCNFF